MNLSSTVIPEPLETSNQGSYSEATATVAREPQENTNPNLPPFKTLIKWLSYYHTQTGSWPEPEEGTDLIVVTSSSRPQQTGKKPPLTIVPNNTPETVKPAAPGKSFDIAASMVDYPFRFRSSTYYLAAQELIKKYKRAAQIASETINLVLASFLALCHHPVFLTEQKADDGDSRPCGLGMYLPLGWWSKVLRMRKATLGNCLKELETWGLIECCSSQARVEFNYSKPINRYYRLAVILPEQLPVFTLDLEASIPEKLEPVSKAKVPEPLLVIVPLKGTGSCTADNSMNMISKIHDLKIIKNKPINHDHSHTHGPVVEAEVGTIEEKLEFLACKATFPGYSSPEGLTALASGEALKFAANPALELSTLRQVYNQVLAAWNSGKCSKNPLGFFHYTLTQRLKQKESRVVKPRVAEQTAVREPLSGNRLTQEANSQPESVPGNSEDKAAAAAIEEQMAVIEVAPVAAALMAQVETAPEIDLIKLLLELKEQVVEALADRFKEPELAGLVSRLDWEVLPAGCKTLAEVRKPRQLFFSPIRAYPGPPFLASDCACPEDKEYAGWQSGFRAGRLERLVYSINVTGLFVGWSSYLHQ